MPKGYIQKQLTQKWLSLYLSLSIPHIHVCIHICDEKQNKLIKYNVVSIISDIGKPNLLINSLRTEMVSTFL